METIPNSKKGFFDLLQPKQAFVLGCVCSLLIIGTIGCLGLGFYVWQGRSGSFDTTKTTNAANSNNAAAGAGNTATGTTAVDFSKLPAVTSSDHVTGRGDITIVSYSDFQCPYCKTFDATMQQIMKDYSGKIKWVYREFPLSFHNEAQNAAEAAECAGAQGKFWEYAAKLFANQSSLGEDFYKQTASDLGLNTTDFDSCRSSDKMLTVISDYQKGASTVGVRGTPSSFLISKDGTVQQIKGGAVSAATLKTLLDKELAK